MAQQVDLNKLRETILKNQEVGNALPARRDEKVYATPEGRIVTGDTVNPSEERQLSEVHQATFATLNARLTRDKETVAKKFPHNTRTAELNGTVGWYYDIRSETGDSYTLFAYHDGSLYQVAVVSPNVEGKYSPHNGHLFSNGHICFGSSDGMPTLEQAYAKSVLWANGFSIFLRTGQFPFSRNNLG
jgi:hypothetical protein